VRRMKEIDLLAPEVERHGELLANRVRARSLRNGPKVLSETSSHVGICRPAEEQILGGLVDPREVPQQIANVGSDAVVAQLPRVDRYPHSLRSLTPNSATPNSQTNSRRPADCWNLTGWVTFQQLPSSTSVPWELRSWPLRS